MRITLIRPRMNSETWSPTRLEPLALGILATLTPKTHQLRMADEYLGDDPLAGETDLAAITVGTFSAARAYAIAAAYRQRGVPVVMGGFHPTLLPEEAMEHADAVVVGDAEASWPAVLDDLALGRLQRLYRPADGRPYAGVRPDRTLFAGRRYLPLRLVQFGRGCPRNCEYCSIRAFYHGHTAQRPVAEVVDELKLFRSRRILFVDDNLLADRDRLRQLLEAITPLRLRWSSQMDISIADDPELLALVRRSGCQCLIVGFESLSQTNLDQMNKGWNQAERHRERLHRLRTAGIMVYGTFLFGYDQDDAGSFQRTLDFAMQERLFLANFNPLQPIPGTPLYDRLRQENRLVYDRWWLEPAYRWNEALLRPAGMSAQELADGCRRARETFHSLSGMVRRLFSRVHLGNTGNLVTFLGANIASGLDIRNKAAAGRNRS